MRFGKLQLNLHKNKFVKNRTVKGRTVFNSFVLVFEFFLIILTFSGCVSNQLEMPDAKYFSWFSPENELYAYLPVQNNFDIVKSLSNLFIKDLSEKDSHKMLVRTNALYLSCGNLSKQNKSFQVIATGHYPVLFLKMALKEKRGWKKNAGFYTHSSGVKLKIINSSALMLSNTDINKINELNKNDFSMNLTDKIGFVVKNPNSVLSKLLGKIQLPVSTFLGTIADLKNNNLLLDADLQFSEQKALKPAQLLLRLAGFDPVIKNNSRDTISVSGVSINVKRMEELWIQK